MRKFLLLAIGCLTFCNLFCQTPEDALRTAWFIPNGTARSNSIGGAVGALGGDLSAGYTNPAGLGMYKTQDLVISSGCLFNSNGSNYRGTLSNNIKSSAFQFGATGAIVEVGSGQKWRDTGTVSSAVSVSINQLANYNNRIHYEGTNDYSSYSEQYLEELTQDNANINAASNNYPFGSSLAFFSYLVDSLNDPQGNLIGYRSLVPLPIDVMQQYDETDKGGLYEPSLAVAINDADKWYFGFSWNFPFSSFTQDIDFTETDAREVGNNNFHYSRLSEHHTVKSHGTNARFGLIYRPRRSLRLGFAFHTPSLSYFKDDLHVEMTTDTEGYAGANTSKSSDFPNAAAHIEYDLVTPYKLLISGAYVFKEVQDVRLQKGFISADIEFVNYRGSRFYAHGENPDQSAVDYYHSFNDVIKSYYQGALNFRLGGELKFSPLAIRVGGAYYASPYADHNLKANRILAAAGLGYRGHGLFIDLTFGQTFNKDVSFPYRLYDKANTFAELKNQRANVLLTVGIKL